MNICLCNTYIGMYVCNILVVADLNPDLNKGYLKTNNKYLISI